jgi:pimeloyl-ACP methyl ester carboxylesterase
MNSKSKISFTQGNTLIRDIPSDYIAGKCGYWLELPSGLDKDKKLFYYDFIVGKGSPTKTIVFVHGNPESSYTYRKIVKEIESKSKQTVRILAMDHIGFGLSDQADFEMVDMHHAANLSLLIEYLDLQNVTLVIHDWGGAIGIGAFIDTPDRIDNLVLMNTTVFPMPLKGLTYKNFPFPYPFGWNTLGHICPTMIWKHIPPIVMLSKVGKLKFLNRILAYTYRLMTKTLSEKEVLYRDMFASVANSKSSMRNVRQTNVWGHGYQYIDEKHGNQNNSAFYQNIQSNLNKHWGTVGKNIGVRAFFGEWDPIARNEVKQQWLEALPQLHGFIETFSDVGHFVEEWKYEEIAMGILDVTELN